MTDIGPVADSSNSTSAENPHPSDSFDARFEPTFRAAYRAAYRLVGNRQDALECAQEALTRAYPKWERLAQRGDPLPWVVRVAANLATDRWRKNRSAKQHQQRPHAPLDSPGADAHLAERVALVHALASLSRRQRDVVVLRYVADLSEAAVAEALDISTGSVKQHATRGLAALRLALEE